MRGRVLVWLSLGLNAALAGWVWLAVHAPREHPDPQFARGTPPAVTNLIRTNVVIRRQNFVWSQIESADYPTYISNLRLIGCPESTIRDIIVADVNQLYARRRAADVVTAQQQWWRSEPDVEVVRAAAEKVRSIDHERRTLLTKLLGPDWESSDYPFPAPFPAIPLDGPLLGALPADVKAAVQEVERKSLDRQQDYLEARQKDGRGPDPAELARLRQETRQHLARLLSPEQLEEYLLRYSNSAGELRGKLRGLSTAPDEFRNLFRAVDPIDQQLQLSQADTSPEGLRRRRELEQQREAVLRQSLGPERYQEYEQNQDPLYRQARSLIEQAGVSTEKLLPVAAIVRLTDDEQQRIRADASLTLEERVERLAATREAQRDSLRQLLGEEAYQRYLEQAPRLWENAPP